MSKLATLARYFFPSGFQTASRLRTMKMMWRTGGLRSVIYHLRRKLPGDFSKSPALVADSSLGNPNEKQQPSLVVYTIIFADYDELLPTFSSPGVDWICITDRPRECPSGWSLLLVHPESGDIVREARRYKILAHRLFSHYDFSIYLDGNMQLVADPRELVEKHLRHADLASLRHPERTCTYQEAEMVKYLGLDDSERIDAQMDRYRKSGFPPHHGLLETAVLIRRHSRPIADLNELWWREVSQGSRRDQLSLVYAAWQKKLSWQQIPGGRENNHIARYFPHQQKKRQLASVTTTR